MKSIIVFLCFALIACASIVEPSRPLDTVSADAVDSDAPDAPVAPAWTPPVCTPACVTGACDRTPRGNACCIQLPGPIDRDEQCDGGFAFGDRVRCCWEAP